MNNIRMMTMGERIARDAETRFGSARYEDIDTIIADAKDWAGLIDEWLEDADESIPMTDDLAKRIADAIKPVLKPIVGDGLLLADGCTKTWDVDRWLRDRIVSHLAAEEAKRAERDAGVRSALRAGVDWLEGFKSMATDTDYWDTIEEMRTALALLDPAEGGGDE